MVCTGAKSEEDSYKAAKRYAKAIRQVGYDTVNMTEFMIQNIVASHDVGFQIKLETLNNNVQQEKTSMSRYEPELFPGLIFRMEVPKLVLLIFASGKIVLTGAKKREEIHTAYNTILPYLRKHRKEDATTIHQKPKRI